MKLAFIRQNWTRFGFLIITCFYIGLINSNISGHPIGERLLNITWDTVLTLALFVLWSLIILISKLL